MQKIEIIKKWANRALVVFVPLALTGLHAQFVTSSKQGISCLITGAVK